MAKSHAIQNRVPRETEDLTGKVCICQQNQLGIVSHKSGGLWQGFKLLEAGLWVSVQPTVAFDSITDAYPFLRARLQERRINEKPGLLRLTCGSKVVYVRNIRLEDDKTPGVCLVDDGHDDVFDKGFSPEAIAQFGIFIEATDTDSKQKEHDGDRQTADDRTPA